MLAVICIIDAAEVVDTSNEGTHEAKVDESDEECRSPRGSQSGQRRQRPRGRKDGDNEQDKDGGWSQKVVIVVAVNEPCLGLLAGFRASVWFGATYQHADDGNQRHELEDAP